MSNSFKGKVSAKSLKMPLSQATKTAAEITGVSESTEKKNKREVIKLEQSDEDILSNYRKIPQKARNSQMHY